MLQENRRQAARMLVKKVIQGKGDPRTVIGFLKKTVSAQQSPEDFMEEVGGWLIEMKEYFKRRACPSDFSLSQFMGALQKVAEERGIGPHQLYTVLFERFLLEGAERDEEFPASPKYSTKDKILDAALEVFSEKGFHSATVDEIADRAGLGKGTLYRYFANKETLFHELVRIRLEELEKKAWSVFDGQDDVLTMIRKYLQIYFEFFDRNQRLYRLIVQERLDLGEKVQDLYLKKVMRRAPLLKRKIYEASQQGVLKDVDFQTVFYGVMGFIHGVIQKWLAKDCAYSLVEELPTVIDVLFYGFVKTPTRRLPKTSH